jgi:hypothetical protein
LSPIAATILAVPRPRHRFCDEFGDDLHGGLGWIVDEGTPRTSHALAADHGVWLVDAVDVPGLDERIADLGKPRGVIQLLDRHDRDCASIARRLGVPHHRLPFAGVPGAPFEPIRIVRLSAVWRELALWWPAERTLVTGDALGTLPYFREPGARLGIHPLLRLTSPRKLADLEPFRVLCGHGEGVHGEGVADELRVVLARSRRGLPAALVQGWRWAKSRD